METHPRPHQRVPDLCGFGLASGIPARKTSRCGACPIFRYTEKGTPWWGSNTVGIQHIYPAGGIGLDSPPELLERAPQPDPRDEPLDRLSTA